MDLPTLCQKLISTQRQEKYLEIYSPDGTPGTVDAPVPPGKRYMQFRLSQMYLKDSMVLWKGYIPMVIAVVEFMYNRQREIIPVYLGNNLLDFLGNITAKEDISFHNTHILGPAPYMGGDVAFFMGLFRVQSSDLSDGLFNLAETLMGPFSKTPISSYITVARSFKTGLSDLLGLKEVTMQMGNRTVFTDMENDPYSLREGHLVYINAPAAGIETDRLRIRDDRLYILGKGKTYQPFEAHDFCLVKIACPARRRDYRILGFSQVYDEAVDEIYKGNPRQAKYVFQTLMRKINQSPDLIRPQKFQLIKIYKANLLRQRELCLGTAPKKAPGGTDAMRGASASDALNRIAYIAGVQNMGGGIKKRIKDMAQNMEEILGKTAARGALSDQDLDLQLDRLDTISPPGDGDPADLVEAISISDDVEGQGAMV